MTVSKILFVSAYQRLISETSTMDKQQHVDFVSILKPLNIYSIPNTTTTASFESKYCTATIATTEVIVFL
jgi:hypothetical protein